MRTRRKSKAQAAAVAATAEQAGSVAPSEGLAGPSKVEFSVSIPDDLDLEYLSRVLPDVSFDAPSQDTILSLYRLVVSQAVDLEDALRDIEELRADSERKDIELDQALQDRESSVSSLDARVKGLQEELTKAKQERDTLGESYVAFPNICLYRVHPSISHFSHLFSLIQKQFRITTFHLE
jgi:nucleoprotein TPR